MSVFRRYVGRDGPRRQFFLVRHGVGLVIVVGRNRHIESTCYVDARVYVYLRGGTFQFVWLGRPR